MTYGELKKKLKELEIDHPKLDDDTPVYAGIQDANKPFCDVEYVEFEEDGNDVFALWFGTVE